MRNVSFIFLLLFFIACSGNTTENLGQQIDQLIAQDNYEEALEVLDDADSAQTDANLKLLQEKVHLNYGIYLEYHSGEMGVDMRSRMTGALRQYIEVLKINANNQKARAEINQIMSIYQTMPQSPPEEILEELRELGFEFQGES